MTQPKPDDYWYQGKRFTHYLNHGGTWQTMEHDPRCDSDPIECGCEAALGEAEEAGR